MIAILLSQYLGPEGKGIQSLILTTITFILVFSNLVGGATLVYLVPRHDPLKLVIPSYLWTLITSIIAYVILRIYPIIDEGFVLHACILSALNSLASINLSILIGKEKIKTANFLGLIQPAALILSLAIFFFYFNTASVNNYITSLYISFILSFASSVYGFINHTGRFQVGKISEYASLTIEMVRFGILNQVAHVTQMLSFRLSFYVLDHYHGTSAVGVYSNGISLAESIWLISKSISLVQYARISNLDDRQRSARLTVLLIKASVVVSLLIMIPLFFLPVSFYVFLFGEGFESTRIVIRTLTAGVLIYNFSILLGHYFSGTGRYFVNALASTIGLAVSITLYLLLIPACDVAGAGWATSASYMITTLFLITWFSCENPGSMKSFLIWKEDLKLLKTELQGYLR
jgi:O-antigen/teichoic acid export membrane protein